MTITVAAQLKSVSITISVIRKYFALPILIMTLYRTIVNNVHNYYHVLNFLTGHAVRKYLNFPIYGM